MGYRNMPSGGTDNRRPVEDDAVLGGPETAESAFDQDGPVRDDHTGVDYE